jgi:hypothetical protein
LRDRVGKATRLRERKKGLAMEGLTFGEGKKGASPSAEKTT